MNDNNRGGGNGTSWRGVIAVAVAGFQLLWLVVWWALTAQLVRLENQTEILSSRTNSQFTRIEELKRVDEQIAQIRNRIQRMSDQTFALDRIMQDKFITKDQYIARHDALTDDVRRTQDRLNELRQDFSRIYTPTDTIKELQDRIKLMEAKIFSVGVSTGKPPQ